MDKFKIDYDHAIPGQVASVDWDSMKVGGSFHVDDDEIGSIRMMITKRQKETSERFVTRREKSGGGFRVWRSA